MPMEDQEEKIVSLTEQGDFGLGVTEVKDDKDKQTIKDLQQKDSK